MDDAPIGYPEISEVDARGSVAAIFADVRRQLPMVPALLRSIAMSPTYLSLAWDQGSTMLGSEPFTDAAAELSRRAAVNGVAPHHHGCRELLARFASGRMLLLASALAAALRGELSGEPATAVDLEGPLPEPGALRPSLPPLGSDDLARLEDIRFRLRTPIINSLWVVAAEQGMLGIAWDAIRDRAPQAIVEGRQLHDLAAELARDLPWSRIADQDALKRAGIAEVAPAMLAVLDAYAVTLARVLSLVACCRQDAPVVPSNGTEAWMRLP